MAQNMAQNMAQKGRQKVAAADKAPARARKAPRPAAREEKGVSLVTRAYGELKEKIIRGYFLPGQYLNESAVCDLLGVGRTPVHQALQRLELDGLIEIMPRKGLIVLPDSIAEVIKILDSRIAVEPELARHAAALATPEAAAELRALAGVRKPDAASSDIDAFIISDRAFHRRLAELSGNQVLSDFARNLHERCWRYWYLHLWQTLDMQGSTRQHEAIADAVAAGDGEAAADAMRRHILSLRRRLLQIQSSRGGPPGQRSWPESAADRADQGGDVMSTAPELPAGMPKLDEVLLHSNDIPWRPKSLKGLYEKVLWRDETTGASICLIKFDKGASIPEPHMHASNQFMFCLQGHYEYTRTGVTLKPGSFYWNPKGNVHGPTIAHEDTVVVEIYDGPHYPQRPSWYDNDEDAR